MSRTQGIDLLLAGLVSISYDKSAKKILSVTETLTDVPELNQYAACDEALIRCVGQGPEWVDAAASEVGLEAETDNLSQAQKAALPMSLTSTA